MVSPMIRYLETDTRFRRGKANRVLLHPIQRQRLTGKNPSQDQAAKVRALGEERADSLAKAKNAKTRHVITGILPYARITSQKQDAVVAASAVFDRLRRRKSPTRGQRRVVQKDQLPSKGLKQLGCVSKIPSREKSICTESRKIGIEARRQILQRHVAPYRNSGKKGSVQRDHSEA